jgi:hypothetical protein
VTTDPSSVIAVACPTGPARRFMSGPHRHRKAFMSAKRHSTVAATTVRHRVPG